MKSKRIILELGAGVSLHGGDYTKAAVRAVDDALHHSSLSFIRNLGLDAKDMEVTVTVGVQKPELVNKSQVAAKLPYGQVTVNVVKGGLDVLDTDHDDITVLASAAIAVHMELSKQA